MKILYIFQITTVTGAVITIVGLLLVAALIGYFSAWFYAKSIYTPITKALENDKAELQREVSILKDEVSKLNGKIDKLNSKIVKLEAEAEEKEKEFKKPVKEKK